MKRILNVLVVCLITTAVIGQNNNSQEKKETDKMHAAMEDAMSQLEILMDSIDFSQMFNSEMFQLDNMLDSTQMQLLKGGDLNDLFENMFPEGIESQDLERMMQQGMMMFQNMDMKELESLMEGIDMESLNKMLEGLDFSELEKLLQEDQSPQDKSKKKLKRI